MAKQATATPRRPAAQSRSASARKPKAASEDRMEMGEQYICDECGLMIAVVDPCDCDDACYVTCCEQPMQLMEEQPARSSGSSRSSRSASASRSSQSRVSSRAGGSSRLGQSSRSRPISRARKEPAGAGSRK